MDQPKEEAAVACARLHLAGLPSVKEASLTSIDQEYLRGERLSLVIMSVASFVVVGIGLLIDIRFSGILLLIAVIGTLTHFHRFRLSRDDVRWTRYLDAHKTELFAAHAHVRTITGSRAEATRIIIEQTMTRE